MLKILKEKCWELQSPVLLTGGSSNILPMSRQEDFNRKKQVLVPKKKIQSTGEKKIKITQIEGTSSRTITDFHL